MVWLIASLEPKASLTESHLEEEEKEERDLLHKSLQNTFIIAMMQSHLPKFPGRISRQFRHV